MDLLDEMSPVTGDEVYEGFVKLKLVHARGFSALLPDLIVIGSKWFQARFFTAPLLSWVDKDTCCQFGFELDPVTRLIVRFTGDRLVSHQPDGASIYRCRVSGPRNLDQRADGECETDGRGNIFLWLYHHTDTDSADAILESGHFRGSAWNIQGTIKKLTNVHYVYFTSLARVTSDDDLKRIAMATNGLIPLTRTNAPKDIMWLKVYRASMYFRTADFIARPCSRGTLGVTTCVLRGAARWLRVLRSVPPTNLSSRLIAWRSATHCCGTDSPEHSRPQAF